jgi:hypothetical protein
MKIGATQKILGIANITIFQTILPANMTFPWRVYTSDTENLSYPIQEIC